MRRAAVVMAALLGGALSAQSAPVTPTRAVRMEGLAAIMNNDLPAARDEAIVDAKRKAAEQEVGVHLEATTKVKDAQVISQEVNERVDAYVANYAVEKDWQAEGIYHVMIVANVVTGAAMDRELTALARKVNNVAVAIRETNVGQPVAESYVAHAVTDKLVSAGYRVLDPERLEAIRKERPLMFTSPSSPSPDDVRRVASRFLVNVLVTGSAESRDVTPDIPDVKKEDMPQMAEGRATLKVLLADTAETVCAKDVKTGTDRETKNRLSSDRLEKSGRAALEDVAVKAASAIVDGNCIPGRIHDVTLEVERIPSYEEYQRYTAYLRLVRYVRSVRAEGFSGTGRSIFHVTFEEETAMLASKLDGDPHYKVTEQSANRIVATYK